MGGSHTLVKEIDEQFIESFQFYVGGELHYTVHGSYKVCYVP